MDDNSSEFFAEFDFDNVSGFTEMVLLHESPQGPTRVYRGRKDAKRVAIKCLKDQYRDDPFYNALLRKEYELGAQFDHHGIAAVYSFEKVERLGMCIISEFIDGETLAERLKRGQLSEKEALPILGELCDVVDYLHLHQTTHFDLKPGNIMLTFKGAHVKLLDFGFADAESYAILKGFGGTTGYCAPEQINATEDKPDYKSDIYALGKIMGKMVSHPSYGYRKAMKECVSENRQNRTSNAREILRNRKLYNKKRTVIIAALMAFIAVSGIWILTRSFNSAENDISSDLMEPVAAIPSEEENVGTDSAVLFGPSNQSALSVNEDASRTSPIAERQSQNEEKTEAKIADAPEPTPSAATSVHPLEIITYDQTFIEAGRIYRDASTGTDTVGWPDKVRTKITSWIDAQTLPGDSLLRAKLLSAMERRLRETTQNMSLLEKHYRQNRNEN